MKKYNKILFLIVLVFVLLIVAVVFLLPKKQTVNIPPLTTPTSAPVPVSSQFAIITNVFPKENIQEVFLPIQQLSVTFSKFVPFPRLVVTSIPEAKISVDPDPNNANVIVISPRPFWQVGITIIKISSIDVSGKKILNDDFYYRINTSFPQNDPGLVD